MVIVSPSQGDTSSELQVRLLCVQYLRMRMSLYLFPDILRTAIHFSFSLESHVTSTRHIDCVWRPACNLTSKPIRLHGQVFCRMF